MLPTIPLLAVTAVAVALVKKLQVKKIMKEKPQAAPRQRAAANQLKQDAKTGVWRLDDSAPYGQSKQPSEVSQHG